MVPELEIKVDEDTLSCFHSTASVINIVNLQCSAAEGQVFQHCLAHESSTTEMSRSQTQRRSGESVPSSSTKGKSGKRREGPEGDFG